MEKENKKFRLADYIWIIPFILGLILMLFGISKLNSAKNMYVPPMGDDGWFDASASQSKAESFGIVMCAFGGIIAFMGTIMCYVIPRAIRSSKKHIKSFGSYINDNIIQPAKAESEARINKLKQCKYCGSLASIDSTECESCGGKEFKKHKH